MGFGGGWRRRIRFGLVLPLASASPQASVKPPMLIMCTAHTEAARSAVGLATGRRGAGGAVLAPLGATGGCEGGLRMCRRVSPAW